MSELWTNFTSVAVELITTFGLRILAAIAIFFVGRWVAQFAKRLMRQFLMKTKMDQTLILFVDNLVYFGLLIFAGLAALGQLGVQTASIVALLGAAGLAVGLALQGSLSNFAAGILMIIFRPFQVGDWIEGGGVAGIVEEIQLLTTILRTVDNKTIIVPNSKLMDDNITNFSSQPYIRLDLVIGVSYDADIDHTKQVLEKALAEDPKVLDAPAPIIGVLELADNSVNFAVRPFVKPQDYWSTSLSAMERIKKALDTAGIGIPYPQRDLHIISSPNHVSLVNR